MNGTNTPRYGGLFSHSDGNRSDYNMSGSEEWSSNHSFTSYNAYNYSNNSNYSLSGDDSSCSWISQNFGYDGYYGMSSVDLYLQAALWALYTTVTVGYGTEYLTIYLTICWIPHHMPGNIPDCYITSYRR